MNLNNALNNAFKVFQQKWFWITNSISESFNKTFKIILKTKIRYYINPEYNKCIKIIKSLFFESGFRNPIENIRVIANTYLDLDDFYFQKCQYWRHLYKIWHIISHPCCVVFAPMKFESLWSHSFENTTLIRIRFNKISNIGTYTSAYPYWLITSLNKI